MNTDNVKPVNNKDDTEVIIPGETADFVLKQVEKVVTYQTIKPQERQFSSQLEVDELMGDAQPMEVKLPKSDG